MEEAKEIKPYRPNVPIVDGQLVPQDFEGLYRISQIMAASGMVPGHYINKPEAVFVAVQMGMEIGLSPMASVQNIAVINGNPSIWGDAALAIVSGSPLLVDFEESETGTYPSDDFKCVCKASRKGRSTPTVREYSIADAKTAGLWGNKDPWKKHPKRMLQMRARSRCLRDAFPDLLKGIRLAEEVMDYDVDMTQDKTGTYVEQVKKIETGDTSIYVVKDTAKSVLSDETINIIKQSFELDSQFARAVMIECGADSIEKMSQSQADKFMKEFNKLLDCE